MYKSKSSSLTTSPSSPIQSLKKMLFGSSSNHIGSPTNVTQGLSISHNKKTGMCVGVC